MKQKPENPFATYTDRYIKPMTVTRRDCVTAATMTSDSSPPSTPFNLLHRVVARVRQLSEEGDLPLFAWTMGLPLASLKRMLEECQLPPGALATMDRPTFERIERLIPKTFHELRLMLFQNRTRLVDTAHADYLSRSLAGACFGSRQLWQDIGLDSDDELCSFMATFFNPLALQHKSCRHWKQQLFKDLHERSEARFSVPNLLLSSILLRQ